MDSQKRHVVILLSTQMLCCVVILLGPVTDSFLGLQTFELSQVLKFFLIFLFFCGLVMFLIAILNLGKSLTPNPVPKESSELVVEGLYSYFRHPIYSALIVVMSTWAVIWGSYTSILVVVVLVAVLRSKAILEEKLLLIRYGKNYEKYMLSVNRFFPLPRFNSKQ
jgi:protein-S-isoprenylcysteine O-methyltransferase Ste14